MTSISEADVRRVARLARLHLSDREVTMFSSQLAQIVSLVETLNELDTAAVAPMAHAADLTSVVVADEVRAGLNHEAALGNAPKRDHDCFLVPAVLGDAGTA